MNVTVVCFSVLAIMIPVIIILLIDYFTLTNPFDYLLAYIASSLEDEDKFIKLMKRLVIISGILLLASVFLHQLNKLIIQLF